MADNGTNWYLPRGFESSHSAFFFEDKKKIRFWKHPTQSFTRHRYQHVWTSKRHWYQFWYLIFVHLLHVKGIIIFSCCLRNSVIFLTCLIIWSGWPYWLYCQRRWWQTDCISFGFFWRGGGMRFYVWIALLGVIILLLTPGIIII